MESITPYFDNFIPVIPSDYTYHTTEHDVCWDECCPCKQDKLLIERLREFYAEGLLTAQEVEDTLKGRIL